MRLLVPLATGDEPRRRGRFAHWAVRITAALGAALALVVLAGFALLHSADRPWVKHRIQRLALSAAGLEIDYGALSVDLRSSARLDDIVVKAPPVVRALTPELLRVGSVEVRWSLRSLLSRSPRIESIAVRDMVLSVVLREDGKSSFDEMSQRDEKARPASSVPLSQLLAKSLAVESPVGAVTLDNVAVSIVRTNLGNVEERIDVDGIALAIATMRDEKAQHGTRVRLEVGSDSRPIDLHATRTQGESQQSARAALRLSIDATGDQVRSAVDLRMQEQTFAPTWSAAHHLHATAHAGFDPQHARTLATLEEVEVDDDAARASATIELPDEAPLIVRRAEGDIAVERLLRWVPAGMIPLRVGAASAHLKVEELTLASPPELAESGGVELRAEMTDVRGESSGATGSLARANVVLHASRTKSGAMAARGTIDTGAIVVNAGIVQANLSDMQLAVEAEVRRAGQADAHATAKFGRLRVAGPASGEVRDARLALDARGLLVRDALEKTEGDVSFAANVGAVEGGVAERRFVASGVSARVHSLFSGHAPYNIDLALPIARLRAFDGRPNPVVDTAFDCALTLRDAIFDAAEPKAARGLAHLSLSLGESRASVEATKHRDDLDFTVSAHTPSLRVIRPFLTPAATVAAAWDQMGCDVRSSGHVRHLLSPLPSLRQSTALEISRPASAGIQANSLSLALRSDGDANTQEATVELRAKALSILAGAPFDDHVVLSGGWSLSNDSVHATLEAEGRASVHISAAASFERATRSVAYSFDGNVRRLAALAPLVDRESPLHALDLSRLELVASSRGLVRGVVRDVARDGAIALEANLSQSAWIDGEIDARTDQFHWAAGDVGVSTPRAHWHAELASSGGARTVKSHVDLEALHLAVGPDGMSISGVEDDTTIGLKGDLSAPLIDVTEHGKIGAIEQQRIRGYPLEDMTFALHATRDHDGIIHVEELAFVDAAAGTTASLKGNLEYGPLRKRFSITSELTQDLSLLSRTKELFSGRGKLTAQATVTSPDLTTLHLRSSLKGSDVFLKIPRYGVELEAANGEVPITVDLRVEKTGVGLRRDDDRSPYSMLRFADQHPLLSRSGFISIGSLRTPYVTIAPLVGNLEIERNTISLRQFEMGVREGRITGQSSVTCTESCGPVWNDPRFTAELHVRASGVQSSHGEPFDGNIAVVIESKDRTIDGRAEVLRIGERHLEDLLDMADPDHKDPATGRVRTALALGYPDRVHVAFDHGFVSARFELGGLAKLVSISEMKGIPTGPIIDKVVKIMNDTTESP